MSSSMSSVATDRADALEDAVVLDAVVVGAGFAGMYMLHKLRELGLTARVYEAGTGVGGTWYWNRYPGARVDVESLEYSYQFSEDLQQKWVWSERYATQPELLRYAEHVAERFDLKRDIRLNTRVQSAHFDESTGRWQITTDKGAASARFFILASGCLSSTNVPDFKGLRDFKGNWYHTGGWPHDGVDFTGKRVAVVGTGSSAIQSIPVIAQQAKHLFVFQRTATYSVPAHNGPVDPVALARVKANYREFRERNAKTGYGFILDANEGSALSVSAEERNAVYESRWARGGLGFYGSFGDFLSDKAANDTAADFIRQKIRSAVRDPAVAELLCPKTVVGCKRLCVDTGYYETYNRPNVTLVDVSKTPIDRITATGLRVGDRDYDVDAIVFATGFDAMTGSVMKIDIRGKRGLRLAEKWAAGPRNYLGLGVAGFPNMFLIAGPGSPSVLTNMLPSIEQHVRWIGDCIATMQSRQAQRIEPMEGAEETWVSHVNELAAASLFPSCNSWYLGANVPGKPRVFMPYSGGFATYVERCNEVASHGYEGFSLS
ncbi:MAG TPA: NAD(P)/FAD-dependent oxidoreductase [Pseudomonadales bacterium]|nr:NAD(P)/FAD-dependent oxidoreductase [Pseudomonadales bacterium]